MANLAADLGPVLAVLLV